MTIKVAIRVDASVQIGTGHFMRCLTLADALKKSGAQLRFVCRYLPEHLRNLLTNKGLEYVLLETVQGNANLGELAHADWLGVSQAQDATDSIEALSAEKPDWLVADHYALDFRWETALRQTATRILVIDDIADRIHDCDVLLDQNFFTDMAKRYTGKIPEHCKLLLGPHFALLREEFLKLHEQVMPRTGSVRKILVFFGGVDADNYTGHAIEALSGLGLSEIGVDVVVGAQHPRLEEIKEACARQKYNCHVQTADMAELMAAADMAIGAGGSASWERCCLGVPTLAICTAANQKQQVEDAAGEGLLYAPEIRGGITQAIQKHAGALIENSSLRQHLSRNSMQAVDGRGVLRVISGMGSADIEIRRARPDDSEKMFKWRNHSSIREVSRNLNVIDWQDHQKWFASVQADDGRILLVGESAGVPIGVARFDMQDEGAEISIYLVPEKIASGLGRAFLQSAEQWLATKHPEIREIRAHVLGDNVRSQKLFTGAGYRVESTHFKKSLS